MKKIIYLLVLSTLVSCDLFKNQKEEGFCRIDLSNSVVVDSVETFYEFNDKYPVAVKTVDSLMYIIQTKAKECVLVLNMNTGQVTDSLGHVGHGPNDLVNPNFILSTDDSEVLIEDGNLKKMMKIEHNLDSIKLVEYIKYPDSIFLSSEINLSENFIVGRKVNALKGKMFFVYDRKNDAIFEVECLPKLTEPVSDVNYTFAPAVAFNEHRNRIVIGMYFFDMFHLYDLKGKHIKTYCFSDNPLPTINKEMKGLDLSKDYSGIVRTFSTDDHCYLLRMVQKEGNEHPEYTIIQLDWEGRLINSYLFKDDISGQFYVDEKKKKIYVIRRYINPENEEIFGVVSCDLLS